MTARPSERAPDQLRTVTLETGVNRYAEGSCLVSFGHTKVLVTATVEENVPGWMRGKGSGWVTAEYGMLPRATHTRGRREAASGKQSGRTQEIQRLIGRSLRAVVDLKALGDVLDSGSAGLIVVYQANLADHVAATIKAVNRVESQITDMAADEIAAAIRENQA